jgi:cell division protease FtsH
MNEKKKGGENYLKGIIFWILIFISFALLIAYFSEKRISSIEISYSKFLEEVNKGNIKEVVVTEKEITGEFKKPLVIKEENFKNFKLSLPIPKPDLLDLLTKHGIEVKTKIKNPFWDVLLGYAPWFLIFIVFWFLFLRQIQGGSSRAFSFGKVRAKILTEDRPKVTFDDVAGCDEAKEELKEVIEFLKNPQKFQKLGARIPKGVLLLGPPGTGKTLLAKAVAGEAKVPFLSISGSDFVELFVGVGAARVRDLFDQARKMAPAIVFIDEIDAVGRLRGAGLGGGHDEREQTLNQLLVEMDGFDTKDGVIIMAATNRPDILDPALLRPGRFDRQIVIDRPDVKGREEILKIHTRKIPLGEDVDLKKLAKGTPGFAGADLANMVNEAALLAARKGKNKVEMEDFEEAKDKVLMGLARKSLALSQEEKRLIAYHEAGHALVSKFVPNADPIHKVTIIPRGRALGVTQQLPEDDRHIYSKEYLESQLAVLLGGRAAEKIVLNTETTGAASDLERATEIARKMVCEWGMSEKIGAVTFGKVEEEIFLGREIGMKRYYSEKTAEMIDEEIKNIIKKAEETAEKIIKENKNILEKIVEKLLEKEILEKEEIDEIINSNKNLGGLK